MLAHLGWLVVDICFVAGRGWWWCYIFFPSKKHRVGNFVPMTFFRVRVAPKKQEQQRPTANLKNPSKTNSETSRNQAPLTLETYACLSPWIPLPQPNRADPKKIAGHKPGKKKHKKHMPWIWQTSQ